MIRALAEPSDDVLYEVVNGVRVQKPMGLVENLIANLLIGRLGPHCRNNQLGYAVMETLFTIPNSGNDRKPDVAFVSFQRWPADRPLPRVNAWPVAPDLAIEVISPTDKAFDVVEKVHEYFNGGVRQVWHVYSHIEQVFIFDSPTAVRVLTRADELTAEPVVPGFRMPMAELFPLAEPRA
jgi:Uma2 family endonuclease